MEQLKLKCSLKLCICNNDLYHHNLYHFCYNRMERSQNLMYQICVTGLNMIGIQRHNFTVNVAAFSPENRGKKGCFSLTFFCPLQRTQWTGWVSGGYDTQNRNFAIKQKEMSLFWHQIFVLYLWNFTSGAPFLGSNRWIATEMCDLIVQKSEDLHEACWNLMVSCNSDIGLMLLFLQVVQSRAPHQNLKIPQEDLQVTLSSVAAEVCCLTRTSDSRCTWYKLQTAF